MAELSRRSLLVLGGASLGLAACGNGVGSNGATTIDARVNATRDYMLRSFPSTSQLLSKSVGVLYMPLMTEASFGFGGAFGRGALRINLSKFFTWTGAFLIVVAAGVLAYGVHDLQEAGVLPGLHTIAFDVSHIVTLDSVLGTVLKGVFNFSPVTTVLEATVWVAYVVVVGGLFIQRNRAAHRPAPATVPQGVTQ